jgi:hypothetical protein
VLHPDLSRVTFTSNGSYAGLWILDAHGTVVGNALRLKGPGHRPYTSTPDALPAGTYTVYVVGQGHVVASVPLRRGEQGLSLTATRATTASYLETRHTMQRLESTSAVRLHIPSAPAAMGYGGGFIDTPAHGATSVDVCLARRDAGCRHHVDPEYSQDAQLADRGYYGASFALPPYLVDEGRDVLVTVDTHSTGATAVTAWVFTVRLS